EINNKPKAVKPPNEHERVKYEFTGPLVFQCIKCKAVVGDSFAFVAAEHPEAAPFDIHTLPSARTQQMSINRLQDMVMMLHQRLSALEYNMGQRN
ncbi:13286_t:CDS:2, partial [Cetraspora pellucida]